MHGQGLLGPAMWRKCVFRSRSLAADPTSLSNRWRPESGKQADQLSFVNQGFSSCGSLVRGPYDPGGSRPGGSVYDLQEECRHERSDQTEQGQPVEPARITPGQALHEPAIPEAEKAPQMTKRIN